MNPGPDPNANPPGASEPSGGFPPEFWGGMPELYSGTPQPQQPGQPFGIGWDHPIFQGGSPAQQGQHSDPQTQQPQQPQQPPQQNLQPLQPQFSTSDDLFAHPQPAWQQNPAPRPETQQSYQLPQYHVPQFQQSSVQQRSPYQHPPQPSASPYQQYHLDQSNYFTNPPAPTQGGYLHQQQQAPPPPRPGQPVNQSPAISPASLENTTGTTYGFGTPQFTGAPGRYPGNFQDPHARQFHQTINPQFLTASQQPMPSPGQQQGVYGINPAELESRNYQPYPNASRPSTIQPQYLVQGQLPRIAARPAPNGLALAPMPGPAPRKKRDPAAKLAKVKKEAIRAGTIPKLAGEGSSSESDYSDSSDDEEPEPSPLPVVRPTDIEGGTKYDVLKIVWFPRNKRPQTSEIRNSMVAFSDLVKRIRDTWKTHSEALKKAENQNQEQRIPTLKTHVVFQRRLLEVVVTIAVESGHPGFINRYGEHPHIVSSFYSFLLDRFNAADYNGTLTIGILKLMTKFISMDQDMLEKTKNDKILPRFAKKGGEPVQKLVKMILDNSAAATKWKKEKPPSPTPPATSKQNSPAVETKSLPEVQVVIHNPPRPPPTPVNQTVAANLPTQLMQFAAANPTKPLNQLSTKDIAAVGAKRLRENDGKEQRVAKRPAGLLSPRPAATKAPPGAVKPAGAATVIKKVVPAGQNGKPGLLQAGAPSKQKINMVTPKATLGLFSNLSSASKRPGTSNAARAAAAAAAAVKEKENPRQVPPAFSFSQTMADLSKPKAIAPPEPVEELPPETEEEREKRLRKEERRKLRVRWKPDESLVQVKLFTHDPEEEIGHDSSMMRDVDDVGGEGRMLKLHRGFADLDEEEDRDVTILPYVTPSTIDLEELGEERDRNFTKTGGKKEPDSPQKRSQDQREANSLGVFYTSPADIPISPKEPPADSQDEPVAAEVPFGEPDDCTKTRSRRYFDMRAPKTTPKIPQQPPTTPSGNIDISALLKILQTNPQHIQQPAQQPHTPAVPQANVMDLEKTFSQFRNQSASQTSQPAPPVTQSGQATSTPALDLQRIMAMINPQAQAQGQQQTPAFPPLPPAPASTQASNNLASLLAQFPGAAPQQQNQQAPQQQSNQSYGGFGQGNQQHGRSRNEDWSRKRHYDGPAYEEGGAYHKRFRVNGDPHKPKKHPKAGLVPCRYWKEGKCLKGDDCTFRHDPID